MTTGSSQPKRKPGRPRKTPLKEDNPAPKRRGRPPKNAPKANADSGATPATLNTSDSPAPKRMGRPPKNAAKADVNTDASPTVPKKTKAPGTKRMGRPPKVKTTPEQHQEQAQSSQAEAQEPVVLEVVGTSIQPSFVVQDPSSPRLLVVTEASPGSSQGLLNKLPSRKEASMAKKLAVKKTQAMKKSTVKKVGNCARNNALTPHAS